MAGVAVAAIPRADVVQFGQQQDSAVHLDELHLVPHHPQKVHRVEFFLAQQQPAERALAGPVLAQQHVDLSTLNLEICLEESLNSIRSRLGDDPLVEELIGLKKEFVMLEAENNNEEDTESMYDKLEYLIQM